MKTNAVQARPGDKKDAPNYTHSQSRNDLKTDFPLSEKDEVKMAERRMAKPLKRHL